MDKTTKGWVVCSVNHPVTGTSYIVESTFSLLRKDAIAKFLAGSGNEWEYWKRKYNFRVVKAFVFIRTEERIL